MIELLKFQPDHLKQLDEQDSMAWLSKHVTRDAVETLASGDWAFTVKSNGRVLICGGVHEYWAGRGEAWAYLDKNVKKEFLSVHRAVERFFTLCPVRRIEAVVDSTFCNGHRWVRLLGFKIEGELMRAYLPGGKDAARYVMVRG